MSSTSRHDLRSLVEEAEADYRATAQSAEMRCLDELDLRRRQLAAECSRLLQRIRRAAGA